MGGHGTGSAGLQSEINVTPLVDVVLVLLIIFMVVVPLALRGYDIDIPRESRSTAPAAAPVEQVVLTVEPAGCPILSPPGPEALPASCRVHVNDETVPVTELAPKVAALLGSRAPADRVLFLSADDALNYEGVMRIVDVAKSGVEELRIGMVTARPPATRG